MKSGCSIGLISCPIRLSVSSGLINTVLTYKNLEIQGFRPKALQMYISFLNKIFYYIGVTSRNTHGFVKEPKARHLKALM